MADMLEKFEELVQPQTLPAIQESFATIH